MRSHGFALYDAFSETVLGGSRAGLVADAHGLDTQAMQAIAFEVGAPATAFLLETAPDSVSVRFFSTRSEYPMCGHATLGLMTWLEERGDVTVPRHGSRSFDLQTPAARSVVDVERRADGRLEVMLNLQPARLELVEVSATDLYPMFGPIFGSMIGESRGMAPGLPVAISRAEFTHLILPLDGMETLTGLQPDFGAIAAWSRQVGVDTIVVFTQHTVAPSSTVHCREFCPAVGTDESAAAGTTNRALAGYLHEHGLLAAEQSVVIAEQGYELGRPSLIKSKLQMRHNKLVNIRVGGVATKTIAGTIYT